MGDKLLWIDRGANDLFLRLSEIESGKDLLAGHFPAKSICLPSPDAHYFGVITPDGNGVVLDLRQRREIAKFVVGQDYRDKIRGGFLMADRSQFYVMFEEKNRPEMKVVNGPFDDFEPNLGFAKSFNGRIYAFDRTNGGLRWFKAMPNQAILLTRFEELPVILCSSIAYVQNNAGSNQRMISTIRTLDKRTGKICISRDNSSNNNSYHTLLVDPGAGTVDLVGLRTKIHHFPQP